MFLLFFCRRLILLRSSISLVMVGVILFVCVCHVPFGVLSLALSRSLSLSRRPPPRSALACGSERQKSTSGRGVEDWLTLCIRTGTVVSFIDLCTYVPVHRPTVSIRYR